MYQLAKFARMKVLSPPSTPPACSGKATAQSTNPPTASLEVTVTSSEKPL